MNGVEITECPPQDATRALEVLFAGLTETERHAMVASLSDSLRAASTNAPSTSGLFVACDERAIVGAAYVQEYPGRTAILWPPHTLSGDWALELRLARAADAHLARRNLVMAQALVPTQDYSLTELLKQVGFVYLTQLDYMIAETPAAHRATTSDGLCFETYNATQAPRMASLIEATYESTQDCPELNGVRDANDVLLGYQSTGSFDPGMWFFVTSGGRDVGVLLLTEHAEARHWELVYMALLPRARGRGFGKQIVQFALAKAQQANVGAVLLAVDARNQAGIGLYQARGFRVWDRRVVYWKRYARP